MADVISQTQERWSDAADKHKHFGKMLHLSGICANSVGRSSLRQGLVSRTTCRPRLVEKPNTGGRQGLIVRARKEKGGRSYDGENARRSDKGQSYSNSKRRKGRPAWQRSPDDTPLRDGNRDRLMGLLTDRAARTLLYYFFEMNPTMYGWFTQYLKEHKIPRDGSWDDVSGETFLRELLATPIQETRWGSQVGVDSLYDCTGGVVVDPRNIAQRIMEIRSQIAKEWIEELTLVSEENSLLMRETLATSLSMDLDDTEDVRRNLPTSHPDYLDDSAAGGDD